MNREAHDRAMCARWELHYEIGAASEPDYDDDLDYDLEDPPMPNVPDPYRTWAIARTFSQLLKETIGQQKVYQVVNANVANPNKDTCASHDHCDANLLMSEAFEKHVGRKPHPTDIDDVAQWNAAWKLAKERLFSAQQCRYWHNRGTYQSYWEALQKELVPPTGQAASVAGEIVRLMSRIYYDYFNNGGCNTKVEECDVLIHFVCHLFKRQGRDVAKIVDLIARHRDALARAEKRGGCYVTDLFDDEWDEPDWRLDDIIDGIFPLLRENEVAAKALRTMTIKDHIVTLESLIDGDPYDDLGLMLQPIRDFLEGEF